MKKQITLIAIITAFFTMSFRYGLPAYLVLKTTASKAQFLTKAQADTLYKAASYTPTLSTWGYSIGVDNSPYIDAPRPDYRFNIDYTPLLGTVATSSNYNDLVWIPDVNNLPQYYHKYESDTLFKVAVITGSVQLKRNTTVVNSIALPTPTLIGTNGLTVTSASNNYTVTQKREQTFIGTTNSSGDYIGTFTPAYSTTPNIQANPIGGNVLYRTVMNVSTTGFTVNVSSQNTNTLLGIISLVSSVTPVNTATVHVLIKE